MISIPLIIWLAPLFFAFEIWQLVIAERYLGVKHIRAGIDPRNLGPAEPVAFVWSAAIVVYWVWTIMLLGTRLGRVQAACMLVISMIGYSLRRNSGLKWVLVILTLEGALRIGMLLSLAAIVWRRL